MERTLLLEPVDAWFFRDGRPYNKHESSQVDVESTFPPAPSTLVGSIRAALAREHGWNGARRWSEAFAEVLGNGFEDLGQLSFLGPWLVRQTGTELEPLFPAPLHLLGQTERDPQRNEPRWVPAALLVPGKNVRCDLDEVRLPAPDREGSGHVKDAAGLWITRDGLNQVLQGHLPAEAQLVPARRLWRREYRVGLARNEVTRATDEQALYSARYVRLCRGVALAIAVRGVPADWKIPFAFPLGGEGRLATCVDAPPLTLPRAPAGRIRETRQVTVTLLTPLSLPLSDQHPVHLAVGEALPGLPGTKIVSACVERPVRLGGWDSLEGRPLPLTPFFPAGSTWFCTAEPRSVDKLLEHHGKNIGLRTASGFGQIVLGTWNEQGVAL